MGYADDLATCSTSKFKLDRAIDIVAAHGRTWRYNFNAKKSRILVYGEDKRENTRNAALRTFKSGDDIVTECETYDHVGIRAIIFGDDVSGLEERISKAKRSLNAISWLGIRRCGLTMQTCNFIFWSIIVPIATYGCELLILTDDHVNLLEEFQGYAGKKIQRFYSKTTKVCTFFALGWIRLQRYIEVKKLIFFHNVLALKDDEPARKVLCERCGLY